MLRKTPAEGNRIVKFYIEENGLFARSFCLKYLLSETPLRTLKLFSISSKNPLRILREIIFITNFNINFTPQNF